MGLTIPVFGIKGYTIDVVSEEPRDLPVHGDILFLGEHSWYFTIAPVKEGRYRVSAYGDV